MYCKSSLIAVLLLAVFSFVHADENRIEQSVVVKAKPSEAWAALTTKKGLAKLIPDGSPFSLEVNLKIGGKITTKVGDKVVAQSKILSFDPNHFLSSRYLKNGDNEALTKTWSVVYFFPAGKDATRITFVRLGADANNKELRQKLQAANRRMAELFIKRFGEAAEAKQANLPSEFELQRFALNVARMQTEVKQLQYQIVGGGAQLEELANRIANSQTQFRLLSKMLKEKGPYEINGRKFTAEEIKRNLQQLAEQVNVYEKQHQAIASQVEVKKQTLEVLTKNLKRETAELERKRRQLAEFELKELREGR